DTVKVKVTFEETQTKVLEDIGIEIRNLNENYSAKFKWPDEENVNLTLNGPTTTLNSITTDDMKVFVDLAGYSLGEYQIPMTVESIPGVIIEPNSKNVTIIITE
nr:hypothetical protein [Turicibacter sp.]